MRKISGRFGAVAWVTALMEMLVAAASIPAQGQTYRVLYTFAAGLDLDGANPYSSVVLDSEGNLYGTTANGGAFGYGVVFKVSPTGSETVLHSFAGYPTDGRSPYAGLLRDAAGNLYGTTFYGGPSGGGNVFKLTSAGEETVLHNFATESDGRNAAAGLVESAGYLYGMTEDGGKDHGACAGSVCGVVFKLSPMGTETVLHPFAGSPADGSRPIYGTLAIDRAGNFYGTTYHGGSDDVGTIFKLSPTGRETVLYSFTRGADGGHPLSGLILDAAGNLYGTTEASGFFGAGTVFKLSPSGKETVLYSFTGGSDGGIPQAGVVRDEAGNLYGTTVQGGSNLQGVLYKLDPLGNETVLHTFTGGADGGSPTASLVRDTGGNLYGTAGYGGNGSGVVFELTP